MKIKFTEFQEGDMSVLDWIRGAFPYAIDTKCEEESVITPDDDDVSWCEKNVSKSLYTIGPNDEGFFTIRCKEAKWEYWGNVFYFSDREDAMRFKLVFGGEYTDYTLEESWGKHDEEEEVSEEV